MGNPTIEEKKKSWKNHPLLQPQLTTTTIHYNHNSLQPQFTMNFNILIMIVLTGIVSAIAIPDMSEMDTSPASPLIKRGTSYDCKGSSFCGLAFHLQKRCDEAIGMTWPFDTIFYGAPGYALFIPLLFRLY